MIQPKNIKTPVYITMLCFMVDNHCTSITELSYKLRVSYSTVYGYLKYFESKNIIRKVLIGRKKEYRFTKEGKYLGLLCKELKVSTAKYLL